MVFSWWKSSFEKYCIITFYKRNYKSITMNFHNICSLVGIFWIVVIISCQISETQNCLFYFFKADSASFLKIDIFFFSPKYFFHRAYKSINSHTLYATFLELQNFFLRHSVQIFSLWSREISDTESRINNIILMFATRRNPPRFHIFLASLCYAQNSGMTGGVYFFFANKNSKKSRMTPPVIAISATLNTAKYCKLI